MTLRFINQPGYVTTEDVKLTGRAKLGTHWQALGSAIYQDTRNDTPEPLMDPNYPDYMIKGGLMGKYGKVDIGLFNSYYSKGSLWHERYNNLQANLSFDISSALNLDDNRVHLSLFADNILDEKLFQLPSDVGENEPIPHSYRHRLYATV